MTGPILFTERLVLRPPQPEDFDGWATFQADPEATRFVGGALRSAPPPGAARRAASAPGGGNSTDYGTAARYLPYSGKHHQPHLN